MIISELVALIKLDGVKQAVGDIKNLSTHLQNATKTLYDITAKAREFAVALDMYHINTGMSTEQLQQLSYKAAQAGVSMGELGATIEHLQNLSAKANLGEGWSPVLSRFGVMPGQDPVTQLNRISAGLKRLRDAGAFGEAKQLASEAGINNKMYYALMRGGTDEMNKQFILTQKEQNALVKLNVQWNKFWFYLKQITIKIQAIGASLQNKLVDVLINAIQGAGELLSRFVSMIEANENLQYIIGAIVLLLNPWLGVLTAIALILEDIFVYFQGGNSITGKLVEWAKQSEDVQDMWLGMKTAIEAVGAAFRWLKGMWDEYVHPALVEMSKYKLVVESFGKSFHAAVNPVGSALTDIGRIRRVVEQGTLDPDYVRPTASNVSGGDVIVTNNVNMNGEMNTQTAQDMGQELTRAVEESARQSPILTAIRRGLKYESAT